ncbi:hypothetical protein FHR87_002707 [Azomonas macrocytogenes]|uniref:Uncharacterized protein n=1 Tax=Azomonas macrocytogenes TaxID=69962 RepID=A0A839T4D6_AZOMA|nr:hypothetical protein [Azomonas macrocytogenes]
MVSMGLAPTDDSVLSSAAFCRANAPLISG